jgi:hypothetical protein
MSQTLNSVHILIKSCQKINVFINPFGFGILVIRYCFVLRDSDFEFILIKKESAPS